MYHLQNHLRAFFPCPDIRYPLSGHEQDSFNPPDYGWIHMSPGTVSQQGNNKILADGLGIHMLGGDLGAPIGLSLEILYQKAIKACGYFHLLYCTSLHFFLYACVKPFLLLVIFFYSC